MSHGYDNDVHMALLMSEASGQDLSDFRDAILRFAGGDAVFYVKVRNHSWAHSRMPINMVELRKYTNL